MNSHDLLSPTVTAAAVTGFFALLMAYLSKKRPTKASVAELVDARTRWLVDELRESADRAVAAADRAQAAYDGCRAERDELAVRVRSLEEESGRLRQMIETLRNGKAVPPSAS